MSTLKEKLTELKELLDAGLINEADFELRKRHLLVGDSANSARTTPHGDLRSAVTRMAGSSASSRVDAAQRTDERGLKSERTRMGRHPESEPEHIGLAAESGADLLKASTRMPTADELRPVSRAASATTIQPGRKVAGRYMAIRKIGEDCMGAVWQALDEDTGQDVSLQFISDECARSEGAFDTLCKEFWLAWALPAHPNLLRILDVHLRENTPFVSYELALGRKLREPYLREGNRLPVATVTAYVKQLLSALDALHGAGVVHQDIKPQNILLTESGQLKLMDYGISASIRQQMAKGGSDESGTLLYMAPERQDGRIADRRSDLYAVGIMAYLWLTDRFPFDITDDAVVIEWQNYIAQGGFHAFPRPFNVLLPKLLAVDPDDRWPDAATALSILEDPSGYDDKLKAAEKAEAEGVPEERSTAGESAEIEMAAIRMRDPGERLAIVFVLLIISLGTCVALIGRGTLEVYGMILTPEGDYQAAAEQAILGDNCDSDRMASFVDKRVAVFCPGSNPIFTSVASVNCARESYGYQWLFAELGHTVQNTPCIISEASINSRAEFQEGIRRDLDKSVAHELVQKVAASFSDKQMLGWLFFGTLKPDGDDYKELSETDVIKILRRGLREAKGTVYEYKGPEDELLLELNIPTSGYVPIPNGGDQSITVVVLTDYKGENVKLLTGGPWQGTRILGLYDFDGDGLDEIFLNGWGADGMKSWNGFYYLYRSKKREKTVLYVVETAA